MKMIARMTALPIFCLALASSSCLHAAITTDQALVWIRNTWNVADLSDQALTQTLGLSDSGNSSTASYMGWIDFFVNAPSYLDPLARGDYSQAAQNAMSYAEDAAFNQLTSAAGLDAVVAPAELAVLPLQLGLDAFSALLNEDAFWYERNLYFQARSAGNSADAILNLGDGDLLNNVNITKFNGWLWSENGVQFNGVPGMTWAQFYAYADNLYLANQTYPSGFNAAIQQIGADFRNDAQSTPPTPPTIVLGPASITVSVGTSAGFTVVANGTWPLHYQWQLNGVDIPGANGFVCTTPPVQASNNGDQYTVRVSNAQGARTSDAATLTVSGTTPTGVSISSLSPNQLQPLPSPQTQTLHIYGSGFTSSSTLVFTHGTSVFNSVAARLTFVSANELDYDIIVDGAQGDWTAKVVKGSQESNPWHFTVAAPPPPSSGSLTVSLQPAGAISAGAQWQVDSGIYRNNGDTVTGLAPGVHTVSCKAVAGYTTPGNRSVTINGGTVTSDTETYSVVAPTTYTLTLNQAGSIGSISPSPSGTWNGSAYVYSAGSVVQLTASANYGYHFIGWGGDLSGTASPTPITMDGNKAVTANFASGDPRLGTVIVTIQPPTAAAAGVTWGFNANDFRASGSSYTTFPQTYILTIHPVDGWFGPSSVVFGTVTAGQTTNITVTLTPDTTPGFLTVTLSPPGAVTAGAKWHVNGGAPQGNGASVSLPPGANYSVTFDSVPGWIAPATETAQVSLAQTTVVAGNYTPLPGQPSIVSVRPSVGTLAGGTPMTIQGFNFTPPATVLVGGQRASNVTVLSASQITCMTPSNSVYGTAAVVVQTASGNTTNLNGFAYGVPRGTGIELAGSIGGWVNALAAQGSYCYFGEGSTFVALDVSNPATPTPIGRLAMPGLIQDIALFAASGHLYAAVADDDAGVQIVDVTTPSAPALRSYYNTGDDAFGVCVLGGYAYVGNGNSGLLVLDISDATKVQLVGAVSTGGFASKMVLAASGNGLLAYLANGGALLIVDASDPRNPTLRGHTGQLADASVPNSVAVSGNRAFLADGITPLQAVDTSNPDSPQALGAASPYNDSPDAVATAGGRVFTFGSLGLTVYDIVAGSLLHPRGNIHSSQTSFGNTMTVLGTSAFCAGGENGVYIYSVGAPDNPTLSGSSGATAGSYNSVAVNGNYAYLATQNSGLKVFGVSDPANPTLLSQLASGGGTKVIYRSNRAYVGGSRIKILDVTKADQAPIVLGASSQPILCV